jgi:hypothetical protein
MPALLMRRSSAAFITEVSSRSWRPPIISGWATIASRTMVNAGAIDRRESRAGSADGSARNAYAWATSRNGNAYVSTPQPSSAVWSRSGDVP